VNIKSSFLGQIQFQEFFRKLYHLSVKGMNYGNANNYEDNGEIYALKKIRKILSKGQIGPLVLMDVGANIGAYSQSIIEVFHGLDYQLHIFEPAAETYQKLVENVSSLPQVHFHNIGLSNQKDAAVLFSSEEKSSLASLYPRNLDHTSIDFSKKETVSLNTLDAFCEENNIRAIDFLKTDVEGHELKVFEGAQQMLSNKKIKAIQFEFGGCNIDSRTFFKDFYLLLHTDYTLFRIVKNGLVPLPRYTEDYEIFKSSNFLAILKGNH
jgi:FkbM family methyltransferase